MHSNSLFKLAGVSLAGMIISFAILWGTQQMNQNQYYNGYNQNGTMNANGYGSMYSMPMNQNQMNSTQMPGMNTMGNGVNMQGSMNVQGSMNMNNMQGSSSMQGGMMMDKNMMGGMMGGMMDGM
jgi:hypothetical protein